MTYHHIYNLTEFTERLGISDTYGASVACITTDKAFMEGFQNTPLTLGFFSIILVIDGQLQYDISGRHVTLEMHDLIVTLPHQSVMFTSCSQEVTSIHLLLDASYFNNILDNDERLGGSLPFEILSTTPVFHLNESKAAEFYDLFRQIQKAMSQPHFYKDEMIRNLVHISQLYLAEQLYGGIVSTHDIKHKENIFKIFIHLAARNFRTERQVKFYADHLNITTTYLSRVVKELSGNTVYGYLSNFLYNEICMLLKTTDMTMIEISEELSFNDQSAFTNFFKSKSGMTPLAYRKTNT